MDLASLFANLAMAGAAIYGLVAWRLGRRVENEHDAALAALKAALKVAQGIDALLQVAVEYPVGLARNEANYRSKQESRSSILDDLRTLREDLLTATIEVRALWGKDGALAVIRFSNFANFLSRAAFDAFAAPGSVVRAHWTTGVVPKQWESALIGDADAGQVVSEQLTELLRDVEEWASPIIRRRGHVRWEDGDQKLDEPPALRGGDQKALDEILTRLDRPNRESSGENIVARALPASRRSHD